MIGSELPGRREALAAFLSSFLLVAPAREARAVAPIIGFAESSRLSTAAI